MNVLGSRKTKSLCLWCPVSSKFLSVYVYHLAMNSFHLLAAPGLFTAIAEQIGLKLEPMTAPTGVLLVVDKVEHPSAN
jgi:hypothetical protein